MANNSSDNIGLVGVLALQGAFQEHVQLSKSVGLNAVEVRLPEHLEGLDGIIIPGGESTTIAKLAAEWGLMEPLKAWVNDNRPIWGTCAGLIMLADRVVGQKEGGQAVIGGLDVLVERNFFGSQVNSFEAQLSTPFLESEAGGSDPTFRTIFIRAPAVLSQGPNVEVLAAVDAKHGRRSARGHSSEDNVHVGVAVKQGNILGTSFHPELSSDLRWHRYFAGIVRANMMMPRNAGGNGSDLLLCGGDYSPPLKTAADCPPPCPSASATTTVADCPAPCAS